MGDLYESYCYFHENFTHKTDPIQSNFHVNYVNEFIKYRRILRLRKLSITRFEERCEKCVHNNSARSVSSIVIKKYNEKYYDVIFALKFLFSQAICWMCLLRNTHSQYCTLLMHENRPSILVININRGRIDNLSSFC